MKIGSIFIAVLLVSYSATAQTNTFPSTGYVGIGTTTPTLRLQMVGGHGDTNFGLQYSHPDPAYQANLTLWASEPGLTFTGAGIGNNVYNVSTGGIARMSTVRGGSYMRLLDQQIRFNVVRTDGTDVSSMVINASGNVGVGTSSPVSPLHVAGIAAFRSDVANDGYISINPGGPTTQGYINWWKPGENRVAYMGYNDGSSTNNLGLTLEGSNFIINGGNVGIGTITPNAKLAVNGNIRAKEVKVENANWPDYVFKKNYELPSLQLTEQHIKATGHLPGIPSAAEVKSEGVNLSEMNAKLLQKIEELTLYLIDLKKKNDQYGKDIAILKSKIK